MKLICKKAGNLCGKCRGSKANDCPNMIREEEPKKETDDGND